MADEKWIGWHFLQHNRKLRFHPFTEVKVGQKLVADECPLKICMYGLHASKSALDALKYGAGSVVCKVELSGSIQLWNDVACASERTCLQMANATKMLAEFTVWCEEYEIYLGLKPFKDIAIERAALANEICFREKRITKEEYDIGVSAMVAHHAAAIATYAAYYPFIDKEVKLNVGIKSQADLIAVYNNKLEEMLTELLNKESSNV